MKKIVLVLIVLGLLVSCKNEQKQTIEITNYDKIAELQWLIGNWTNITEEEQSYENWFQLNDSTLFSHSFTLVETDTVFAEHLTLQQNKNEVYLTVVAYREEVDKPVTFKMIPSQNGVFTFENPKHDFPSSISYSNPEKNTINAWIEGTIDGKLERMDFSFKRD